MPILDHAAWAGDRLYRLAFVAVLARRVRAGPDGVRVDLRHASDGHCCRLESREATEARLALALLRARKARS